MKRFAVCPISPGNLWWRQGQDPVRHLSCPLFWFATAKGAKNKAQKLAYQYPYGLALFDKQTNKIDWGNSKKIEWESPGEETA